MAGNRNINFHQLVSLFMLSSGLMDHVIVIPFLLGISGRNGWMSVVAVGLLLSCWLPVMSYVMKKTNMQPVFGWIEQKYGRPLSLLIAVPVFLYMFAFGTVTIVDTVGWVNSIFLPETPVWFVTLLLMGVCVWVAHSGIEAIARCCIFLLPLVVMYGIFVGVVNTPRKRYDLLLPVLGEGIAPVLHGMFIAGGGLIEVTLIVLMQHHLARKPKFPQLLLVLWLLVGLTVGPYIGAVAEFGPEEAAHLRYPAYEEWRLVRIGHYVEHVDFLSIFQWLAGAFIRVSLALFLLKDLAWNYIMPKHNAKIGVVLLAVLMSAFVLLPITDKAFVAILSRWYFTGALTVLLLFSLGMLLLAWFAKPERSRVR